MSAGSDYFEYPIQVDKGLLGIFERDPIGIATPWRRLCTLYAIASEPVKEVQYVACYLTEFGYIRPVRRAAERSIRSRQARRTEGRPG